MSLAFLIFAHKNPEQVAHLFYAIYRREDTIILHFDKSAPSALHRLGAELVSKHPNVRVLKSRKIVVAGYPATEAQLFAMRTALEVGPDWHHFINLSGQDFPLKGVNELESRLRSDPEANYIPYFEPLATSIWRNARDRIERFHLDWAWLDRLLRIPGVGRRLKKAMGWTNTLPYLPFFKLAEPPFRYYGGSNYTVLSRAACDYLVSDPKAKRICEWLKHSMHSDEIFVQSVLMNSPFASTVVDTNIHEIDFVQDSPHPKTYTFADVDHLLASPKYFARKFDSARDPGLLERLEERVS